MMDIKIENKVFVDSLGRTRIFRGFNYIDKGDIDRMRNGQWMKKGTKTNPLAKRTYQLNTSREYWNYVATLGVTLVRLGVTWDAIEPAPGQYNEEYLDQIEQVFDICADLGIYIFLDMHQDLYSGFGEGYGDGAPHWAVVNGNATHRIPFTGIWAEPYFFGASTAKAFDNFWNNTEVEGKGLQDHYADMWKHVAERVKDKKNLFGFDFLNEPYPGRKGQKVFRHIIYRGIRIGLFSSKFKTFRFLGNLGKDPKKAFDCITPEVFDELVSSGEKILQEFDRTKYTPFINKMSAAIRSVTDRGIVMQGTTYWGNIGIKYGGSPIEVDGKREGLQCFAPHAYDLMVDTPEYNYASTPRMAFILERHKESQDRMNVPVVLGEWGCFCPSGTDWLKHIEEIDSIIEKYQWSETYFVNKDLLTHEAIKNNVQRSYPMAVAGPITEYKTDKENKTFSIKYICDNASNVTELYIPAEPKSVTGADKYTFSKILDGESGILTIEQDLGVHEVVVTW